MIMYVFVGLLKYMDLGIVHFISMLCLYISLMKLYTTLPRARGFLNRVVPDDECV